jgi:hypothetical protein
MIKNYNEILKLVKVNNRFMSNKPKWFEKYRIPFYTVISFLEKSHANIFEIFPPIPLPLFDGGG